jgi:hypothetical protein
MSQKARASTLLTRLIAKRISPIRLAEMPWSRVEVRIKGTQVMPQACS